MPDSKCFNCGAPATRERNVPVRSVETEHHGDFGVGHHSDQVGVHHDHHHHTEVIRELRPICDTCNAEMEAHDAAVAEVAIGVFKGMAALFAFGALVMLSLFGVGGYLLWRFIQQVP